jgi:hypothetical protein
MTDQDRVFHRLSMAMALEAASGWSPRV